MSRWKPLVFVIAVVTSLGVFTQISADKTPEVGSYVQDAASIAEERVFLLWTMTRDAYTSCYKPAYVIRKLQREFGDSIPLVVAYDELDHQAVETILRRERLSGVVLPLTASVEHAEPEEWEASLRVIDNGVSVAAWSYLQEPVSPDQVREAVLSLLTTPSDLQSEP